MSAVPSKPRSVPRGGYWTDILNKYSQQVEALQLTNDSALKKVEELPRATDRELQLLVPALNYEDTPSVKVTTGSSKINDIIVHPSNDCQANEQQNSSEEPVTYQQFIKRKNKSIA